MDDMILYVKIFIDFTKKMLQLINKFSTVSGCNINTPKSVSFLYTNHILSIKEIKKAVLFTLTLSIIK